MFLDISINEVPEELVLVMLHVTFSLLLILSFKIFEASVFPSLSQAKRCHVPESVQIPILNVLPLNCLYSGILENIAHIVATSRYNVGINSISSLRND